MLRHFLISALWRAVFRGTLLGAMLFFSTWLVTPMLFTALVLLIGLGHRAGEGGEEEGSGECRVNDALHRNFQYAVSPVESDFASFRPTQIDMGTDCANFMTLT